MTAIIDDIYVSVSDRLRKRWQRRRRRERRVVLILAAARVAAVIAAVIARIVQRVAVITVLSQDLLVATKRGEVKELERKRNERNGERLLQMSNRCSCRY